MAGGGTADEPYEITNVTQLQAINDVLNAHYVLDDDINASETEEWNDGDGFEPIAEFTGEFDGQDNTIEDLYIDLPDEDQVGLFASTEEDAEVRDLELENVDVSGEGGVEAGVGSLVGFNEGDITNVSATGNVYGENNRVGGLVGWNDGDVSESYATGDVEGDNDVGGLVGENDVGGDVSESYATGNVEGDNGVGGLVGYNSAGDVSDSYWDTETSEQDDGVGEGSDDGVEGLEPAEMTGLNATENMDGFEFTDENGTWHATEDYPALAWEDTDPVYGVTIEETNEPVDEGETLEVTADVTNWGADGDTQIIGLQDFVGDEAGTDNVALESGESEEISLEWETDDGGTDNVTVTSEDDEDTVDVTVEQPASFEISDDGIPDAANDGETLVVEPTVENIGDQSGETTVELAIDGDEVDESDEAELEGGENGAVTLEYDIDASEHDDSIDVTISTAEDDDEVTETIDVNTDQELTVTAIDGVLSEDLEEYELEIDGEEVDVDEDGVAETDILDDSTVEIEAAATVESSDSEVTITAAESVTMDGETDVELELWPELAGDGTEGDRYQITNAYELQAMNQDLAGNYTLTEDVDASETAAWNDEGDGPLGFDPVGDDVSFNGSLDGQNNSIEGLTIDGEGADNVGLFGTVSDATIEKITITDIDLSPTGSFNVGGVVGLVTLNGDLTISETYVTGDINTSDSTAGGIVGQSGVLPSEVHLSNSSSAVNVTTDEYAGGALGHVDTANISNSHASGDVEGEDNVGGLVGRAVASGHIQIQNSSATGTVTGHDRATTGGLVGTFPTDSLVVDSFASGNVYSDLRAGGLIGDNRGEISESYATGDVEGHWQVGGLVGENDGRNNGKVTESYSTGDVDGKEDVDGATDRVYVGGLIGENYRDGDVDDSYWDDEAATVTEDGEEQDGQGIGEGDGDVTALLTDEMTGANATDEMNVDFDKTWIAGDAETPVHTWQIDDYALEDVPAELDVGDTANPTVALDLVDGSNATATEAAAFDTEGNVSADSNLLTAEQPGPGTITASASGYSDEASTEAVGPDFAVAIDTVTDPIVTDETITVEATLENVGNEDGSVDVALAFDGEELETESPSLEVGESEPFALESTVPDDVEPGESEVTLETGTDKASESTNVSTLEDVGVTVDDPVVGEAVENATVEADTHPDQLIDPEATTDEDGEATLAAINGTELELAVETERGDHTVSTTETVRVDGITTVDFELWPELEGEGTETNPYKIENAHELQTIQQDLEANYTLVNDFDASESEGWNDEGDGPLGFEPIGEFRGEAFTGSLDGNGYEISNLSINREEDHVGLFGAIEETGTVGTVSLIDADVTGEDNVGALVGLSLNGTVTGADVSGSVNGDEAVGGLIGKNNGTISESSAAGNVDGDNAVGGLLGSNVDGTISTSYATGAVDGDSAVGGLAGGNEGGDISTSYTTGVVDGDDTVGGLIGANTQGSGVTDSYWDRATTNQQDAIGDNDGSADGLEGFGDMEDTAPADEMTGLNATDSMDGFEFPDEDGVWHVVDSYPELAWEDTDPFYEVTITETNSPTQETSTLGVTTEITNLAGGGEQAIELLDFDTTQQDTDDMTLESGEDKEIDLEWETGVSDAGTDEVTVASENNTARDEVTIEAVAQSIDAEVTADEATADGDDEVELTVTVKDGTEGPLEDVTIEVTDNEDVSDLGGLEVGDEATTGGDGQATFTATSSDAGEFALEFEEQQDENTATTTATFIAGNVDEVEIEPEDEQTIGAGDEVEFSATATDEFGNKVEDDDREFTWTNADDGLFDETDVNDYNVTAELDSVESDPTTVTVEAEPFFDVIIDDIDDRVQAGDALELEYTLENTGYITGTQDIELVIDGSTEATDEAVDLDGEADTSGTLAYQTDEDDRPDLEVTVKTDNDTATETVTVDESLEETFFDVTIDSVDDTVEPGEAVTVDYTVENTGEETDSRTPTLSVDGDVEATDSEITLEGGDETTSTLTYETTEGDVPSIDVTVDAGDTTATEPVDVEAPASVLEIGAFDEQFHDEDIGHEYGIVEIPVAETNGIETDGLTVTLEIEGETEGTVFEETNETLTLKDNSSVFAFDVGQLEQPDEYTVTVTATAGNAAPVTESETLEGGEEEATVEDYADEDGAVDTDNLRAAIGDWRDNEIETDLLRAVIDEWRDDEPPLAEYANADGFVDTDGLREAIDDWRSNDIETDLLREVIDAWRSGDEFA